MGIGYCESVCYASGNCVCIGSCSIGSGDDIGLSLLDRVLDLFAVCVLRQTCPASGPFVSFVQGESILACNCSFSNVQLDFYRFRSDSILVICIVPDLLNIDIDGDLSISVGYSKCSGVVFFCQCNIIRILRICKSVTDNFSRILVFFYAVSTYRYADGILTILDIRVGDCSNSVLCSAERCSGDSKLCIIRNNIIAYKAICFLGQRQSCHVPGVGYRNSSAGLCNFACCARSITY